MALNLNKRFKYFHGIVKIHEQLQPIKMANSSDHKTSKQTLYSNLQNRAVMQCVMRVKWTYSRLEDIKSVESSWALIDYQEPRNFSYYFILNY